MELDFSKSTFLKFLDYLSDSKLMKPETVRGWRVAATKLLSNLSSTEEADIRSVDLDVAVIKVVNQSSGMIKSGSLNTYKSRITIAIEEFTKWRTNPAGYKPRSLSVKTIKKQGEQPEQRRQRHRYQQSNQRESVPTDIASEDTSQGISLQYPLRPDFIVKVFVPKDLKLAESKRLGAFLSTLSSDFDPE